MWSVGRLAGLPYWVAVLWIVLLAGCGSPAGDQRPPATESGEIERRAAAALAGLEGTVLVADPASGRLLAAVNPRLAFEQSFPPGSAIKPFSALAALATGRITPDHSQRCEGGRRDESGNLLCSHPRPDHPLDLAGALAHSCNDYFLALGERLGRPAFHDYLRRYGFGARTGVNAVERPGRIAAGDDRLSGAIGEGDGLLVTPVQLLRAYLALVSGGQLCRPYLGELATADCGRIQPPISDLHRRMIVRGMRGAVTYGTASGSGLAALDKYVFGKTGTATASNGFRRHGWFVVFTASSGDRPPVAAEIELGLLVFLRRGTGAEAAAVAARFLRMGPALARPTAASFTPSSRPDRVRVRVRGVVRELPLDDYVTGVLQAENGREREREALRAQAVVARTFALANPGRHAAEGYDLCSTTHCQHFTIPAGPASGAAARAVAATTGEVLDDPAGGVAAVYYHAACGGHTSSIASVWGARGSPSWLRGVSDRHCLDRRERHWEDRLTREEIERALRADRTTRAIGRLRQITIADADPGGRALSLVVDGERRVRMRAWDFRLIIGRALGWQMLKSTLFEMTRDGDVYIFRGRGAGHGLGLCQDGAHDQARQGRHYRQILRHYFPGAILREQRSAHSGSPFPRLIAASDQPDSAGERLRRDGNLRWLISPRLEPTRFAAIRRTFLRARRDLDSRIDDQTAPPIEIHLHATTAAFIAATGESGYAAGAFQPGRAGQPGRIDLQPPALLVRRGLLDATLRHELVHATLHHLNPHCPRWLHEGLAIHFAGEGPQLRRALDPPRLTIAELERQLRARPRLAQSRALYAQAWREVSELIKARGEAAVWRMATVAAHAATI